MIPSLMLIPHISFFIFAIAFDFGIGGLPPVALGFAVLCIILKIVI